MHRPIVWSETAYRAGIFSRVGSRTIPLSHGLDRETFEYIDYTERSDDAEDIYGLVSSYNINTYKGRIYVHEERRPIPFELAMTARDVLSVSRITESSNVNARTRFRGGGEISCKAFRNTSRTGRLKGLLIVEVLP